MFKNKNKEEKKKEKIDLKQYDKFSGISHRELNFGLWLAMNKKKFIISLIVILILLSAGFFLYSGYHYSYYLLEGKEYDQKLAQDLSEYDSSYSDYRESNALESLNVKSVQSLKSNNKSDLISEVYNPNGRYFARFEYCFVQGETEILCDNDFIFPLETKHLIALAINENITQTVELRLSSVSWSRVNAHKYPDWSKYYNEHLDFETRDIKFRPARQSPLSDKMSLDVLEFYIENKSPYSYWELPLNIVLYNSSRTVGVYKHTLNEFISGSERSVRLVWQGNIAQADEVKITPRLDIVDPDIYIKY
jgi:hypothetical protein